MPCMKNTRGWNLEDVLECIAVANHACRWNLEDVLESRRRYEAAGWLRKMVGVVGAKDLPAEPSEEEFRIGLRSGLILCNLLNKIQPGAIPKLYTNWGFQILKHLILNKEENQPGL